MTTTAARPPRRYLTVHPWLVRLTHWINAFAIVCMVMSGWGIYNASPIFAFSFPPLVTLGGWLGGSIAVHFAAMWLLLGNGLVYVLYGLASGHFRRHFLPLKPAQIGHDFVLALRFKLPHAAAGAYNAVQRLMYTGVVLLGLLVVASGIAVWKPVQFDWLAALMGGFDTARIVHFSAMAGIVAFVVVHVLLVLIVPKTLLPMFTGRVRQSALPQERVHD